MSGWTTDAVWLRCDEVPGDHWLKMPIFHLASTQGASYGFDHGQHGFHSFDDGNTIILDFADPDFYSKLKEIGK